MEEEAGRNCLSGSGGRKVSEGAYHAQSRLKINSAQYMTIHWLKILFISTSRPIIVQSKCSSAMSFTRKDLEKEENGLGNSVGAQKGAVHQETRNL